jgi:hypothetical protein
VHHAITFFNVLELIVLIVRGLSSLINSGKEKVLSLILNIRQRCTYHKDDPLPPEDEDNRLKQSTEEVSSWDDKFLQEDGQSVLFDIISVRI